MEPDRSFLLQAQSLCFFTLNMSQSSSSSVRSLLLLFALRILTAITKLSTTVGTRRAFGTRRCLMLRPLDELAAITDPVAAALACWHRQRIFLLALDYDISFSFCIDNNSRVILTGYGENAVDSWQQNQYSLSSPDMAWNTVSKWYCCCLSWLYLESWNINPEARLVDLCGTLHLIEPKDPQRFMEVKGRVKIVGYRYPLND